MAEEVFVPNDTVLEVQDGFIDISEIFGRADKTIKEVYEPIFSSEKESDNG